MSYVYTIFIRTDSLYSLLWYLIQDKPDADAIYAHIAAYPVDWTQFTALAQRHKIAPLIHHALTNIGIPSDLYPALTALARAQAIHSLACVRALTDIHNAFAAAHISFIPLKGAVLAALYYGDVGRRAFLDVDILVHPAHADVAREQLATLGYSIDRFPSQHDNPSDYHLHCTHPVTGVSVELHWALTFARFGKQADDRLLWETARYQPLFGGEFLVPSDEAMLVYLCAHGWRHGWSRLSWVCDVMAVIASRPTLNWEEVVHYAQLTNTRRITALGLRLAEGMNLIHEPVVDGDLFWGHAFGKWMWEDSAVNNLVVEVSGWLKADQPPPDKVLQAFYLSMFDNWQDRLAYTPFAVQRRIRRTLTPNERDRAFVRLPYRLRGLYWFVRPIRLLVERLRHNS